MNTAKKLILCGVIALTSACSSSSGSDDAVLFDATAYAGMTFSERYPVFVDMFNATTAAGLADSDLLPTTGTSTYAGATYLVLRDVASADTILLLGALDVNVNFATDELSGGSTDFVDNTDTAYTGELIVTDDSLNRGTDPAFSFFMDGALTNTDDGIEYDLNTDVDGNFYGTDLEYIGGGITTTVNSTSTDGVTYTVVGNIMGALQ